MHSFKKHINNMAGRNELVKRIQNVQIMNENLDRHYPRWTKPWCGICGGLWKVGRDLTASVEGQSKKQLTSQVNLA